MSVILSVKGVELGPQLRSCLKGPISTPPQRLAEKVKVGVSRQMRIRLSLGPESKYFQDLMSV